MKKIFGIIATLAAVCACTQPAEVSNDGIPSDEGMFPFVISFDGVDNATSISPIVEAPAGKDGFIRIEDGHFVNDKGRVRLNATNLTASANFPEHEQAERMAARMARFGINCVRLHYMDWPYGPDFFPLPVQHCIFANDGSERNLDPEMMDRLDYLIYQFKEHGIYVDVNLYVARFGYHFKGQNAINPETQAKEKEYARDLLTHVNPYTGLPLAKDPVVAVVELNNEDALFTSYFGGLKPADWMSPAELKECKDDAAKKAFLHKLEKYESDHWNNMLAFLRKDVGLKAPVTSTQVTYSMPSTFDGMDFYDNHSYWQHPYVNTYWMANNIAMVNNPDGGEITNLIARRYEGKPYTVSEYNHPYPCFYGAEGQPMLHAYAAFQGWDGVFAYSWNNRFNEEPEFMEYFFSFAARTDVLAHFIACAAMYLRGDVKEGETALVPAVTNEAIEDEWVKNPSRNGDVLKVINDLSGGTVSRKNMLLHKTMVDVHATEAKPIAAEELGPVKISDTKELEWNNEDPENGMFIVRTDNVKLFSGFPKDRTIDFGSGITMNVGKTKLGWTTISLTSLNGNGFGPGSTTLIAATGFTHNKDAKFTVEKDENGNPTTMISCRFQDWGTAPIMTEGIPASFTLASDAAATSCWALGPDGTRVTEVPVKADAAGKATIEIAPSYQTVWYEVSVK